MGEEMRVAVLVGSLRTESFSRKVAQALIARAPRSLRCEIVEIGELALYNEDLDTGSPPSAWSTFRAALSKVEAVLFVTPEYNRSIPGCLKNALDVGSRPAGKSVFDGVPAAVVSVTPYQLGAFGANHALRQTFVFLNMPVMQQPEAYVSKAKELFDDEGKLKEPKSAAFLQQFMNAFESWVRNVRSGSRSTDFGELMQKREQIAQDYVNGKPAALSAIVTRKDPATFFSPRGELHQGAENVAARYAADGKAFQPGGTTKLEVLQSASGDLAFWTGYQPAKVRLGKDGDFVTMKIRVTEVFRLEDGDFKLVHRHADMAGESKGS